MDYITKPFDHREVLARVSAHLQQRHLFARLAEQLERSGARRTTPAGCEGAVPRESDQSGLRLVYRAIDILLDEMADPPGLIELAHRVGTNQARLGREFQTHLGRKRQGAEGAVTDRDPHRRWPGRRPHRASGRRFEPKLSLPCCRPAGAGSGMSPSSDPANQEKAGTVRLGNAA